MGGAWVFRSFKPALREMSDPGCEVCFFFHGRIFVGEDDRKGMTTAKEKTKSQIPRKCWVLNRWLLLNMATLRIIQSQVTCGLEIKKPFKNTHPNPFVSVVSYPGLLGHCWISWVYNHSWGPFIPAHFCWDGRAIFSATALFGERHLRSFGKASVSCFVSGFLGRKNMISAGVKNECTLCSSLPKAETWTMKTFPKKDFFL